MSEILLSVPMSILTSIKTLYAKFWWLYLHPNCLDWTIEASVLKLQSTAVLVDARIIGIACGAMRRGRLEANWWNWFGYPCGSVAFPLSKHLDCVDANKLAFFLRKWVLAHVIVVTISSLVMIQWSGIRPSHHCLLHRCWKSFFQISNTRP